jgi:hypothetical protein
MPKPVSKIVEFFTIISGSQNNYRITGGTLNATTSMLKRVHRIKGKLEFPFSPNC